ncbi:MAG: DUF4412 domain-containing protein [Opitutales bacterium]
MKFLLPRLMGMAAVCALAVSAAAFEGKITFALKGAKEKPMTVTYAMKEGFLRMEPQMAEARGTAMIFDWAKQEMIVLMPQRSMYMTMPIQGGATAAGPAGRQPEQKVEKTGKTETILGYQCEQYVTTDRKGETVELWVTDKLGMFMGLGGGGGGGPMGGMMGGHRGGSGEHSWEQLVKGKAGFFPLRIIGHDASGKETFKLETQSIEPGPLPASLFAPPEGYQSFQMPSMPGMRG